MAYLTVLVLSCTALIIYKIHTMSAEILAELKAEAAKTRTSLDNIRGDIARIIAGLPASGGLTAEEVADLKADLVATSTAADTLDKENEETAPPPEG